MINEDFTSTLQRISSNDLWKDSQRLTLNFEYFLSSKLSIEPIISSRILSDPLAGFDNDIQFYAGAARLNYQPMANLKVAPQVNSKWQTQLQQSDQGFGYGLNAEAINIDLFGYKNDITFTGKQDFFPRRQNEDVRIRYKIERQFYESTADTLIILFDRLRQDSFGADSEGTFVRNLTQAQRGFENRLSYRVGADAVLYLRNSISATTFRVKNLHDERDDLRKDDSGFQSAHSAKLIIQKSEWFVDSRWNYRLRSRNDERPQDTTPDPFGRHPSVGFDSEDVLTDLGLRAGYRIDFNDSLGVSASVSKFRYDTSDTLNPNDHDQLKWQLTFSHKHKFTPQLHLTWNASAFLSHFVFISSKFSAGNNWERFIQLTPIVFYQPNDNFWFQQSVTVRAKYQTYDFDDPVTSVRNSVNRQFRISHRSGYALSPTSRIELALRMELAEQGRFFIDGWRQQLALSWRNQELQAIFRKSLGESFNLAPGISFFRQVRWEHRVNSQGDFERNVMAKHTNIGPTLTMAYYPNSSLELLFVGNIDFVNSSGNTEQINNFNLNLNWFF